MASFMSNYFIDNWCIGVMRGVAPPTTPTTLYAAAFTVKPAADGTGGTEVSGGAYARVAVTSNTTNWTAAATVGANRQSENNAAINFPTATANWGTVVGIGWYDASSAGNLFWYDDLTSSQAVNNGFQLTVPVDNLKRNWNNS